MSCNTSRTITVAISIAIIAVFTAMYLLTPFSFDDYAFRYYWNQAGHNIATYIAMVRFEENGRLGNILFPIFDNTLRWTVWKAVFGLTTSAMIIFMGWLCHKSTKRNLSAALAFAFLFIILMPWRARLFVSDYFLNYIPGSFSALILIWLYVYPPKHKYAVWGVILAFFTGLQHEALTLALGAGILTIFILQKFRFNKPQWLITIALFVAAAIQFSSPGLWLKLDAWESYFSFIHLIQYFPSVILLLLSLPLLLLKKCRELKRNPLFIVSTVIALTALVMPFVLGANNIRATWFQQLFAVLALTQLYLTLLSPSKWLGLTIAVVCAGYWSAIVVLQYKFYRTNQAIEAQITDTTPTAFADLPQKKPKWALFIPQQSIWAEPTQISAANLGDTINPKAVIPADFYEYNRAEINRVPGTAGAIEFRGFYLLPHNKPLWRIDGHGHPVPDVIEASHLNLYTETDTFTNVPVSLQKVMIPGFGAYNFVRPAHYYYENRYYIRIDTVK